MSVTANPFQNLTDGQDKLLSLMMELKEGMAPKKPVPNPNYYMTRTEVSKYLKVTRQTLQKWHLSGQLKAIKIGLQYRYRKAVVDQFMLEREGL